MTPAIVNYAFLLLAIILGYFALERWFRIYVLPRLRIQPYVAYDVASGWNWYVFKPFIERADREVEPHSLNSLHDLGYSIWVHLNIDAPWPRGTTIVDLDNSRMIVRQNSKKYVFRPRNKKKWHIGGPEHHTISVDFDLAGSGIEFDPDKSFHWNIEGLSGSLVQNEKKVASGFIGTIKGWKRGRD